MNIRNIVTSACALAAFASIASANITSISGSSHAWAGGSAQSGGWLEGPSANAMSYPWEPGWYAVSDFYSSVQGDWDPVLSWTRYSASGSASSFGVPQGSVGSRLTLEFVFDAPGFVSISTSGSYAIAGIDGFGSVTGNNSLSGWLGAGTHYLFAEAVVGFGVEPPSGTASFSITIPSPGTLSLALLGGGVLCSRRRRGE